MPTEMLVPIILPRVEQIHALECLGIDAGDVRSFSQIAFHTGYGQILCHGFTAVLTRDYVIDLKSLWIIRLHRVAVFAQSNRAIANHLFERTVHSIHAAVGFGDVFLNDTRAFDCTNAMKWLTLI